jgi:hypothetical protein
VVSSKWLYKIKHVVDGSTEKHKARFVACGFSQKEGIDYEETFSHVSRYTSIRTIISIEAKMKWKLHQKDLCRQVEEGYVRIEASSKSLV